MFKYNKLDGEGYIPGETNCRQCERKTYGICNDHQERVVTHWDTLFTFDGAKIDGDIDFSREPLDSWTDQELWVTQFIENHPHWSPKAKTIEYLLKLFTLSDGTARQDDSLFMSQMLILFDRASDFELQQVDFSKNYFINRIMGVQKRLSNVGLPPKSAAKQ